MKYFADLAVNKTVGDKNLYNPAERYQIGLIESWVSMISNALLTAIKIIFGLLTNSIALIADATHSASDILSSLVVLIGFSMSRKKPDSKHPYGHGRTEYLAGLVIAVMLVVAAFIFAFSAYNRMAAGIYAQPSVAAIVAIIFAILVKEFLFFFSAKLGQMIQSEALTGDAWHHRSDSLSSVLVLVALVGGYFGYPVLDAYFGFGVAAFILYAGLKIARDSCSRLLGAAPENELLEGVTTCAKAIDGVVNAHDLEIHDYGSWKVVTIHIEVNGNLSLDEAHGIANQVEKEISELYFCSAIVHLDPA